MSLKLKLFNFSKNLTDEQLDEAKIIHQHLDAIEDMSEKETVDSLKESLTPYTYQQNVKDLLKEAKEEVDSQPLVYNLKDLYKKVERANYGVLYRPALNTILNIINREDEDSMMEGVLNELNMYDWIPEVKGFLMEMNKDPYEIQNMKENGKAEPIYTVIEKVDEGSLAYVGDSWFLINEDNIEKVNVDEYIQDDEKRREIRNLENVLSIGDLNEQRISLKVDENLSVGVSTNDGSIFLNEEKADKETSLQDIFNSPIIPYLKKNQYALLESVKDNIDKFMELDIAMKVSNPVKPYLEAYCFNYKDGMYLYNKDSRTGSAFFKYESASELIRDVQKEFDYDVSRFYENKLSKETKKLRDLEDKEKSVNMKMKDVNESINMLTKDKELLNETDELKTTLNNLLSYKQQLTKKSNEIKKEKSEIKRKMIKN